MHIFSFSLRKISHLRTVKNDKTIHFYFNCDLLCFRFSEIWNKVVLLFVYEILILFGKQQHLFCALEAFDMSFMSRERELQ